MPRFLIVKMSALGDLVHTLPAVDLLKTFVNNAEIHWFVKNHPSKILRGNPNISKIIKYKNHSLSATITKLRRFHYDAVFDLQGLLKTAFFTSLTRADQKIGFTQDYTREFGAHFLYSRRIQPQMLHPHVIFRAISVVSQYLNFNPKQFVNPDNWEFKLPLNTTAKNFVQNKLPRKTNSKLIVLNPGAAWATKRWAPENFAKFADILTHSLDCHFALAYAPNERKLAQKIVTEAKIAKIYDFETDLTQLIELIRAADLFISGDTGPMQIAYALRIPVVSIFGPTNPLRNGPFNPNDLTYVATEKDLDCLQCHKRKCPKFSIVPPPCMQIAPEFIASLALNRLQ